MTPPTNAPVHAEPPDQPFAGVRVVELATGVAGPYLGKLLADLGAEVIKVEPPGGDPARRNGPFVEDIIDPEQSALFLHLNTNKRSIVGAVSPSAATRDAAGADAASRDDLVDRLAAHADVLIESGAPGAAPIARWRATNPALVVVSLTPFGQDGPYADAGYRGEDIAFYALGGPMHATGVIEREPVKLAGNLLQYQCGAVGAVAVVAALRRAERCGVGAHIDVNNLETQVGSIDRRINYLLWRQWTGRNVTRPPAYGQAVLPFGYYPATDGQAAIIVVANWIPKMLDVLDDDELRERFATPAWMTDPETGGHLDAVIYNWLSTRTKTEAMVEAQAGRWPVTALNRPTDLLVDEHFNARNFFVEVDHPVAGRYRTPGPGWRMDNGWALRRRPPLLDEHRPEILAELEALETPPDDEPPTSAPRARAAGESAGAASTAAAGSKPELGSKSELGSGPQSTVDPDELPLAGIRVLDLTVVWSGPYATMLLGDLGAEVIRVDNAWLFPTVTRGNVPRPTPEALDGLGPLTGAYCDHDPGERPWNRAGQFLAHARTKKSVTLDLRKESGRQAFLRLIDGVDVLIENNSVDVLDKLGLGWDVLAERNAALVLVRMPPMGSWGPYRNYLGFGFHFESLAGSAALWGYRDGDYGLNNPVFPMDPSAGLAAAVATMAALRRRDRTGRGELVEVPQVEYVLQHVGEYLVDAARSGRDRDPIGNRHITHAPQGCYPCRGEDAWVVICVDSDDAWSGLVRALGDPAWATEPALATAPGRRAAHD
ncbi:MAG: CaiB/BaiF CoA transferase family protein, partial [Acidimicrobiales bacterium]